MAIKRDYLIEKANVLNEMRANNLTLQELRFFSIYLSKINSRDIKSRLVRFSIEDFKKIMELGKLKIDYFKNVTNSLLSKVVNVPLEKKGNYTAFQLFKECTVAQDENNNWYVEIDAHDKALPLMFEFKEKYFCYQLWNALRLKSSNQLRMYEILKQYEKIGERVVDIDELKKLLGILENEYVRWDNFKKDVLEVCKKSLEENTDIKFDYEPTGKKGKGGKILTLKFKISKNKNYSDPLTLEKFIENNDFFYHNLENEVIEEVIQDPYQEKLNFLKEACENEFSDKEFKIIYNLVTEVMPVAVSSQYGLDIDHYNYILRKHNELNLQASRRVIKSRFGYFKKLIEIDLE